MHTHRFTNRFAIMCDVDGRSGFEDVEVGVVELDPVGVAAGGVEESASCSGSRQQVEVKPTP